MNPNTRPGRSLLCAALLLCTLLWSALAAAMDGRFTYQGRLQDLEPGAPGAGALYDFRFQLERSDGTPLGAPIERAGIGLDDGLFSVELDFGPSAFNGEPRRFRFPDAH